MPPSITSRRANGSSIICALSARAADFARFLALARTGRPYESHMVIEDLPGRKTPEAFLSAIQYQQREHMERSLEYAKKTLDLGVRWRA